MHSDNGQIILDPGAFYILVSREAVTISRRDIAAEMAPYLAMVGEFRVHYAGFFDPGFGHAAAGGGLTRVLGGALSRGPFRAGARSGRGPLWSMNVWPNRQHSFTARIWPQTIRAKGLKLSKHFKTPHVINAAR